MTTKMILRLILVVAGVSLLAAQIRAEEPVVLKTQKDKINYGVGILVIRNLRQQGTEIDLDLVIKGMRDEFSGQKPLMSDKELIPVMTTFQRESRLKRGHAVGEENRKKGEAFLAENRTKEGVVTLPSGLQYKVLKAGDGRRPTEGDTVEVHYRGTLIDGTEFENSYQNGRPATFAFAAVVRGLKEALGLMPVGSKWQLFIPPQLAYGARGAGRTIPPNATLIFELELLAIK